MLFSLLLCIFEIFHNSFFLQRAVTIVPLGDGGSNHDGEKWV